MNNHNIRKRRPYGHGDPPAVPVPLDPSYSPSTSIPSSHSEGFSVQDLHILQQAASILNCHVSQLLGLNRSSHPQQYPPSSISSIPYPISSKRQRLSADMTPASPQEKSSPPTPPVQDGSDRPRAPEVPNNGFSMGIDRSRLAQYFSTFSVCSPCTTCEPQVYGQIPATSPYSYAPARQYFDDTPSMMSNYPILQPNRPMTIQPSTSGEGMVYPESVSGQQYFTQPDFRPDLPSPMTNDMMGAQHHYTPSSLRQNSTAEDVLPQEVDRTRTASKTRELDILHPNQRPPAARRGPFRSNEIRQETAETRRIGSCIRCRMQRIRCEINPDDKLGTCKTCLKVANMKVWRMPCLRYKITDVKLFKPGNVKGYEWTRRWIEGIPDDISQWESMDIKRVKVTEGYTNQPIELRVRRFIPQEGDKLERSWVHDGNRKNVNIPPYAIVNLEEAKSIYIEYIRQGLPECCKKVLLGKDRLLIATYGAAIKASRDQAIDPKESALLKKALQLWMAIRLTTKSTIIVGDETLGMPLDIMDDTSPLRGCIPLPPVMGAQIELVLIHQIQSSLRREMLENLQTMTQANKHQTWFTTYLITFILLHNVALLCQHDAGYARKHGIKLQSRFAREEMVREYQMGANILLAYFHYCNKNIYPFSTKCKEQDLSTIAELDETQIKLIQFTRSNIEKYKRHWAKIRQTEDYENDFYYISQMYEENWTPQSTI
ncbi:uncharacterized protein GGS22DRAFT_15894 [Annulohypoxylon maeteangense]|uniref:uncharacterized protein n=1 Tax=Annulohypoxylon maeteangense TaxID=1927788 RepID=UPI002007B524|nr:uncharacterized protein GGS22DRAFT_15894 [Annulohypoxylon maeteangense]KAI0890616.1 hypothetical protein GGS22DRAFT_15894 [Annulohypoxylon maeteangense]